MAEVAFPYRNGGSSIDESSAFEAGVEIGVEAGAGERLPVETDREIVDGVVVGVDADVDEVDSDLCLTWRI